MNELRKIPFFIACVSLLIAVALELGSGSFVSQIKPLGYGISSLLLVDAVLVMSVTWIFLTIFVPGRLQGKVQGIISLGIGILIAILGIVMLYTVITILTLMLVLVVAVPIGPLIYLFKWGVFWDQPKLIGTATNILVISAVLKMVFAVLLVIANQRFLKVKSMVALIATSVVLNFVITVFQNDLPPATIFAGITDAAAGLIGAIAGLTWAVATIIASTASVLKLLPTKPPGT